MAKRYFFDLADGCWEPDVTGIELADDLSAQREAIRFAGEVLRGQPDRLDHGTMRVLVHDEALTVRFAVEVALKRE